MKAAVFAYSRQGCATALRLREVLSGEIRYHTIARLQCDGFRILKADSYEVAFHWADALIFVGACGIAVRKIAPYVRDKRQDPAVLCIDELGQFVIPVLSGHIGGANALARTLAEAFRATAVITTATDIHHRFSVDAWASANGYAIEDMSAAKAVSARILEETVPVYSDFPIVSGLPEGVVLRQGGALGISISCRREAHFEREVRLIPRILHLGIGCRKGISEDAIQSAVAQVLERGGIDSRAIAQVASIDLKAEEPGLLAFCRNRGLPVHFYSAEELKQVSGEFTASGFVREVTGVENVCERAAMAGAETLIVKKTACNGVTVAVAQEHWEVDFG